MNCGACRTELNEEEQEAYDWFKSVAPNSKQLPICEKCCDDGVDTLMAKDRLH